MRLQQARKPRMVLYDRVSSRAVPYWIAIPGLGVAAFVVGHLAVVALGQREWVWTQLAFTEGTALMVSVVTLFAHAFDGWLDGPVLEEAPPLVGRSPGVFERRFDGWWARIYGVGDRRRMILVVGGVTGAGLATVLVSGLPYETAWLDIAVLVLFTGVLLLAGHAAFVLIQLLRMLTELGSLDVDVPFGRLPYPAFESIGRYFGWGALCVVLGYGILLGAVVTGPFGPTPLMWAWLTALMLFPLAMIAWSTVQIHRLLRRTRERHVAVANRLVRRAMSSAELMPDRDSLGALERALALQASVQRSRTWPTLPSVAVATAATVVAAVAQVMIALRWP